MATSGSRRWTDWRGSMAYASLSSTRPTPRESKAIGSPHFATMAMVRSGSAPRTAESSDTRTAPSRPIRSRMACLLIRFMRFTSFEVTSSWCRPVGGSFAGTAADSSHTPRTMRCSTASGMAPPTSTMKEVSGPPTAMASTDGRQAPAWPSSQFAESCRPRFRSTPPIGIGTARSGWALRMPECSDCKTASSSGPERIWTMAMSMPSTKIATVTCGSRLTRACCDTPTEPSPDTTQRKDCPEPAFSQCSRTAKATSGSEQRKAG